mgnify:CR=1 FL=1
MPRAAKSHTAPAARTRTAGGDPGIVAPIATPVTPASEIEALTGDPNFMSSLARGLAVIRALIEGCSYREIAVLRQTSTRTIANQISAVFRRLRVSGRNELVQRLFRDDGAPGISPRANETLAPPDVAQAAPRPSTARRSA